MKTVTQIEEASLSSGLETTAMGMVLNATSFNHIINSLYKNPLGAIIRELTTNALESHMVANTNRKVAIQLPTTLDQSFVIRDFGTGLDDEEVQKYLNTLFSTSKDKDNNLMGGFGLGSKSPLALVDTFNIISIKNGLKNNYAWIKEPGKLPSLVHLDDEEDRNEKTNEDDGIKIVIPLGSSTKIAQNSLQKKVEEEARKQLLGFSGKFMFVDNINAKHYSDLNDITDTIIKEKLILDLDHVSVFSRDKNTYYPDSATTLVLIGGVNYPFDHSYRTYVQSLFKYFVNASREYIICLKAPIGSLELPMSREEILTTANNEAVLRTASEQAAKDIAKHIKSLNIDLDVSIADFYKQLKTVTANMKNSNGVQFNLEISQQTFEDKDKALIKLYNDLDNKYNGSLRINHLKGESLPSNLLQALSSSGKLIVNDYDKHGDRNRFSNGYSMYVHDEPRSFLVTTSPLPNNVSHRLLFNFAKEKLQIKNDLVVVQLDDTLHAQFDCVMDIIKAHGEYFFPVGHEYFGVLDTQALADYKEEVRLLAKSGKAPITRSTLDYIPGARTSVITGNGETYYISNNQLQIVFSDDKVSALEDSLTGKRIPIGPEYIDAKYSVFLTTDSVLPVDLTAYTDINDPVDSKTGLRYPKSFKTNKAGLFAPMKDCMILKVTQASYQGCLKRLEDAGYTVYTQDNKFVLNRPTVADIPPKKLGEKILKSTFDTYLNKLGLWSRSHKTISKTTLETVNNILSKHITDPVYLKGCEETLTSLNNPEEIFRLYPSCLDEYKGYDEVAIQSLGSNLAIHLLKEVTTKPDTDFNRNLYDLVNAGLNKEIFDQIMANLIQFASQGKP